MHDFLATQTHILNNGTFNLDPRTGGIHVPPWAFKPDHWSRAFLSGLTKLAGGWGRLRVWEVGVGTGVNLMVLRQQSPNTEWYFSDFDDRCVPLAMENLLRGNGDQTGLNPLYGSWDLVTPPKDDQQVVSKVDVVFGCLPQVPSEAEHLSADWTSHYYDPLRYWDAHQNALGLGLNEALLARAKDVLVPGGSVVLNLGGRPGLGRLLLLFKDSGYRAEVVHQETIPQHSETSLASLAALEGHGQANFEFFANRECACPLDARTAEARRVGGETVYHNIYVIKGTLM
mgnify:CR=1 FL=1